MVINNADLDEIEKQITAIAKIGADNTEAIENLMKALRDQANESIEQRELIVKLHAALKRLTDIVEMLTFADKALEEQIKTSNTDRKIKRSVSVKGIVQYEGWVEGHGLTHEEFMIEQAKIDTEIDRLQPQYEEFVQPLPKS